MEPLQASHQKGNVFIRGTSTACPVWTDLKTPAWGLLRVLWYSHRYRGRKSLELTNSPDKHQHHNHPIHTVHTHTQTNTTTKKSLTKILQAVLRPLSQNHNANTQALEGHFIFYISASILVAYCICCWWTGAWQRAAARWGSVTGLLRRNFLDGCGGWSQNDITMPRY